MSGFWRSWVNVWCWATLLFGVVLALGAHPAVNGPARAYYDLIFFPVDGSPELDGQALRLTVGVLGAVMIGWAVTIMAAVRAAHEGAALWRPLTLAMGVWYGVDSAISIAGGAPMNAVSNTVFFAAWLTPMLATGVLRSASKAPMEAI